MTSITATDVRERVLGVLGEFLSDRHLRALDVDVWRAPGTQNLHLFLRRHVGMGWHSLTWGPTPTALCLNLRAVLREWARCGGLRRPGQLPTFVPWWRLKR